MSAKFEVFPYLKEGLKKLEYRGYDSVGIATLYENKIYVEKYVGGPENFDGKWMKGFLGIAHTRWATHGKVSKENSHPHLDCKKEFAIVHNGIIENFLELKENLTKKGHKFKSETDSEVIAHLLEELYEDKKDSRKLVEGIKDKIKGEYAICFISTHFPEKIFGICYDKPLCVGIGKDCNYIASDPISFLDLTSKFFI